MPGVVSPGIFFLAILKAAETTWVTKQHSEALLIYEYLERKELFKMDDDWVPLDPTPNLMEMLERWANSTEPNIGWGLLCDQPIRCIDDLIPETNTHDCPEGRALEAAHASRVAGRTRQKQAKQCRRTGSRTKSHRPKGE